MKNAWLIDDNKSLDVICMGRVAVDLYSEQIGSSLEETLTFKKYLGGCAGNIAVGCSRLGLQSAMFSCVGSDAMGNFLRQELLKENVDITLLSQTHKHLTGLVLLGVNPPDRFPLIFYRENCADMQLNESNINVNFISQSKTLLITGTNLSTDNMRNITNQTIQAAKFSQTKIIFDLDYRPVLWGLTHQGNGETRYEMSRAVSHQYQKVLSLCDLIIGTEEEMLIAGNANSLNQALINIRTLTQSPLVVKKGSQGCCIYFQDLQSSIVSSPYSVDVLNVLGAGDAFMSGFLRGLLRGENWETCAMYGNACGAIVVTRHGCAPAMPYFDEMKTFINDYKNFQGQKENVRISYS